MFFSLPASCFVKVNRLLMFLFVPFWVCLTLVIKNNHHGTAEPCPSTLLSFLGFPIKSQMKENSVFQKVLAQLCVVAVKKHCSFCIVTLDVKEIVK